MVATVLASRLPAGASACAVVQPRWVDPARRSLLLPLTAVDAFVWSVSPIEVYAEAHQRDRMGPGASVRLLRFRGSFAALQAQLAQQPDFAVQWDVPPSECRPDHCVISARRIDDDMVRLERGVWRERVSGVEGQCAALSRQDPTVTEVSVRGAEEMAFSGGLVPLVSTTTQIHAGSRVVQVVQRDEMDSVEAAEILAQASVDMLGGQARSLGRTAREQHGTTVVSTTDLTWDDLRLGIGDRQRESANRRYAELLLSLEPDDAIDARQLTHALIQLRARLALLEYAPIAPERLSAAVALAERIHLANPTDHDSAYLLALLYVRFMREPEKAQSLIDQHAPADPRVERWIELGFQPARSGSDP